MNAPVKSMPMHSSENTTLCTTHPLCYTPLGLHTPWDTPPVLHTPWATHPLGHTPCATHPLGYTLPGLHTPWVTHPLCYTPLVLHTPWAIWLTYLGCEQKVLCSAEARHCVYNEIEHLALIDRIHPL